MSHLLIVELCRQGALLTLMLAGPMLLTAITVGLVISVLQAVTSIQEQTLTFVPKLIAVFAVFILALPWMLQQLVRFTTELFRTIPSMVQ
jgi:flagellar biosynthesis protein FliQ